MKKLSKRDHMYVFEDKDGRTVEFKGSTTFEELIRSGVSKISFVEPEKPLGDNEWRHNGKTKTKRTITRRNDAVDSCDWFYFWKSPNNTNGKGKYRDKL